MDEILIFGGSFNPVTIGHGSVIKRLVDAGIKNILLMPCYGHYHGKKLLPAYHRLEMCRRMFLNWPHVKVSDFEIKNQLSGPTIDLIHCLEKEKKFSQNNISILIGTDNANQISGWKSWETLIDKVSFVVLERPGAKLTIDGKWCLSKPHRYIELGENSKELISSTQFRSSIHLSKTDRAQSFVNSSVWLYFNKQKLTF